MKLLIALPVYNRASIIEGRIAEFAGRFPDAHLLVIDDDSPDGTSDLIKTGDQISVVKHATELGYGGCFMTALEFSAEYDHLIFADIAVKDAEKGIETIINALSANDIVSLSRIGAPADEEEYHIYSLTNQVTEKLNSLTGLTLKDPFSPFKGMKLAALEGMTLEEFDEALILQLWVQAVHFKRSTAEIFIPELSDDSVSDLTQLEHDADRYTDFLDGEILLYPCEEALH